jgi:ubiquitin-like 1-activating enzyme E1 A
MLKEYSMVICSRVGKEDAARLAKATTAAGGSFYQVDCFGWNGAAVVDLGKDHTYREEVNKKLSDLKTLETYLPVEQVFQVPIGDITMRRVDKTPPAVWIKYRAILEYQSRTKSWPSADKADDFVKVVQEWINEEAPHLKDLDILQEGALKSLASVATAEMSPICAVLGGVLGNEVIKAISGKGEPANNVLLFDGWEGKCRNVLVKRKPEA